MDLRVRQKIVYFEGLEENGGKCFLDFRVRKDVLNFTLNINLN